MSVCKCPQCQTEYPEAEPGQECDWCDGLKLVLASEPADKSEEVA